MKVLYIDVETTGFDWTWCQILEIGMIYEDFTNLRPLDELPKFQCLVHHDRIVGQPFALQMHAIILKAIATNNLRYTHIKNIEVFAHIIDWLHETVKPVNQDDYKINVGGKNAARFDMNFLARLPGFKEIDAIISLEPFSFRQRVIDPGQLYNNPLTDENLPNTNECCQRAGMEKQTDHTAIGDCLLIAELMRRYYKLPIN